MTSCDAVILAGGRAAPEMAARAGTHVRALFEWRGKPFVQWTYEALRASERVRRIAIIGPEALREVPELAGADLLLPERESITANLFGAVGALRPERAVLITACDNPLLTTAAFDDFLCRVPADAAVAYPILRHADFLARFPHATNTPIALRDGVWIGGDCAWICAEAIPKLRAGIESALAARKSVPRMLRLLGPGFAARFALKRVTVADVQQRVCAIAGLPFRFVPDCDPVFVIDIDDPVDWDYLQDWKEVETTNEHE